jgi:hypothetical protein|mmetsp:Transcript_22406/g.40704  ORF Transcript_22406/g.40704 Transcript_22406/m.40704 type:complete len:127 (-) Transcript_22406:1387-1767(-)
MGYSDPKYPIVNPSPEVNDCVKSMRLRDWFVLAGVTAGSWSYGYLLGKPVRGSAAATAASIGFTFGTFVILQDTSARLMGYKENAREVDKFGLAQWQVPKEEPINVRNPKAKPMVTKPDLEWKNYN